MNVKEQAQTLNRIFKGLDDAFGYYKIEHQKVATVKKTGKARTESKPLTIEQWIEHLEGKIGLGVVPINRNNKCNWACLDIDSYEGFDHKKLLQDIFDFGLPLVVCKSKSGGAHCFLFLSEEVECVHVRQYLTKLSIVLGHPGVEVFPKQDKLVSENDKGNWLNMPYFNTDERKCIQLDDDSIKELSLEEFVEYVDLEALTEDQFYTIFNDYNPDKADQINITDEILQGAPPCIISLAKNLIQNGTRSDVLIHFGTLIHKKYGPDQFNVYMPEINQNYCVEPLSAQELNSTVLLSLNKDREYNYRCNLPCVKCFCNPNLCIQAKYGIPARDFTPRFENLNKTASTPAIYVMDTNYGRLTLTEDQLNKPREIQEECVKQCRIRPPLMKDALWSEILNELLQSMTVIEPPEDTLKINEIKTYIVKYIQANADPDKQSIRDTDGVYQSPDGYCYFKLQSVYKHLLKYNVIDKKESKASLSIILDELNIKQRRIRILIDGKRTNFYMRGMNLDDVNLDIEEVDFDLEIEEVEKKELKK